jgi:hypothetical protein
MWVNLVSIFRYLVSIWSEVFLGCPIGPKSPYNRRQEGHLHTKKSEVTTKADSERRGYATEFENKGGGRELKNTAASRRCKKQRGPPLQPQEGTCPKARHSGSPCKSKLLRRWRLGGLRFEASWSKKLLRPHLNQWLGVVVHHIT